MNLIIGIVIAIVIIMLLHEGSKPHVYRIVSKENIKEFLYVLLYRGYYQAYLFIKSATEKKHIFFSKYKEKNRIGIYINCPIFKEEIEKEKDLYKIVERYKFIYFEESVKDDEVSKVIVIDLEQNVSLAYKVFCQIINDVYSIKEHELLSVHFWKVNQDPREIVGFKTTPDFEELGVDITLPVSKGVWLVRQIKIFIARLMGRI